MIKPTDQELKTFACEWWHKFGFVKDKATCTWLLDEVSPEHFVDFARAVLVRWGRPAPAPAGEVAELAKWLYRLADERTCNRRRGIRPHPSALTRAAVLLERQAAPVPVAVSERLPGAEDCDVEGKCWWGEPQIEDSHDATWNLCTQNDAEEFLTWGTKCGWLPAHALPLPSEELEP